MSRFAKLSIGEHRSLVSFAQRTDQHELLQIANFPNLTVRGIFMLLACGGDSDARDRAAQGLAARANYLRERGARCQRCQIPVHLGPCPKPDDLT